MAAIANKNSIALAISYHANTEKGFNLLLSQKSHGWSLFRHCEAPVFLIVVTSLQRKNATTGARNKGQFVKYLIFNKMSQRTTEHRDKMISIGHSIWICVLSPSSITPKLIYYIYIIRMFHFLHQGAFFLELYNIYVTLKHLGKNGSLRGNCYYLLNFQKCRCWYFATFLFL